jgi:hypothetical protein
MLASGHEWSLPDKHRPAIGTLGTGQLAATSQATADDAVVILVENGLLPLSHVLAQVGVIGSIESTEQGRLSEATIQSVSDIAASYLTLGHAFGLPRRKTPPALTAHVAVVEDAILTFVLAHEYAHILHADLAAHRLGQAAGQPDQGEKEYQADAAGLRITLAASLRRPGLTGGAPWGPMLFLAGLDVLDRASAAVRHEAPVVEDSPAGPTPFERVNRLLSDLVQSGLMAGLSRRAVRMGCRHARRMGEQREYP